MRPLILSLLIVLSLVVMGIGTHASAPVPLPCMGQLRDTEITISSWVGTQMNGSVPLGNGMAVVNLIADSTSCATLKAKTPGKLRIRYDTSSLQVVLATDGPAILEPMPPVCPPSPSPTPTPIPSPTPSGVIYDFARFDILGLTVNQQDEILASIGEEGYGSCWVFVQTRYFYCLRPKDWTVKFDWARWPFPNGQSLRDAQATQVGQEGYSNVFVLSGQLRASKPRP